MNNTRHNSTGVYKSYGLCLRFPPKVHSLGLWENKDPFTYSVPALEVQMVVIFALTHLLHYPLKRLGIPKLFSEIMVNFVSFLSLPFFSLIFLYSEFLIREKIGREFSYFVLCSVCLCFSWAFLLINMGLIGFRIKAYHAIAAFCILRFGF